MNYPESHARGRRASLPARRGAAFLFLAIVSACSNEARTVAADQPQTPPRGGTDARIDRYQKNAYQIAQGGRYFTWYECGRCHAAGVSGVPDLGDPHHRHGDDFDQVYRFIAGGHGGALAAYGDRIPVEQLWQLTAYVRELPTIDPQKRRRQDLDQAGEPQGRSWTGAVR